MAFDAPERKPLAAEHLAALQGLDRGVAFNTTHTIARELIAMGYATSDWGRLAITEAGRIVVRQAGRSFTVIDDSVCEMSAARADIDQMTAPHLVHSSASKLERSAIVLIEEEPYEDLPPAADRVQKAMRAAGVASGKTGVWVDDAWVHAFIDAFDDDAVE
jgi:hypothetical protein